MPNVIKQSRQDKNRLNIMCVGESGLGKTTFIQSLLHRYVSDINSKPRSPLRERTNHISRIGSFELTSETNDSLEVTCFDSPGYGDFINNQECVDNIKSYITKCHQQWRALDCSSMTEAEFLQADDRIHCVFYFIAPHRMKRLDREFITQIASIVPIIPVISKADTMTVQERNDYLEIVKTTLDEISAQIKEPCLYDFNGEDLLVLGDQKKNNNQQNIMNRLPNIFAIICDPTDERVYPWGTLRISDNQHSDFRRLQTCLFENGNHLKGLINQTRLKSIRLFGKIKTDPVDLKAHHHQSVRLHKKA